MVNKFVIVPTDGGEHGMSVLYGDFRAVIESTGRFTIRQGNRLVKSGLSVSVQEALDTVMHLLPSFQLEITGLADAA